jgi:single-strand DNA-binding protein
MSGLNKVILQGNLTKDPEFKSTPSGVAVTTFSIAVGRRFANPEDEEKADFFNIVAWPNTAEFVANHFTKGKGIVVVGSLQNRSWSDQNGQKHYITEVIADECYFQHGGNDNVTPKTDPMSMQSAIVQQAVNNDRFQEVNTDEELPF